MGLEEKCILYVFFSVQIPNIVCSLFYAKSIPRILCHLVSWLL